MADFRQLALEFVLADDEGQQAKIAQSAAREIQNAAANSNPVARWVESVQPWMPGSAEAEDGETPDWTARAKALDFLSRTLDFLNKQVLKPSQVRLLVSFFGAMFDVDHKAGILPSANALTRIVAMKSFQKQSGNDIIQSICRLKEDFTRQMPKTRLAIYELVRLLITTPEVFSDLQHKHSASAGFMVDLLQLCKSERDPECLMVWFDILRVFLVEYTTSEEVLDQVYGNFKLYFPIALPRASNTGITPEELKLQLRKCFSANHLLAHQTFPFLIGKLDQGDGVTVNVKVDILKTIRACLDEYKNPVQSIVPYVNQIWSSLKYEVRNGEIEDTIWGTLEVLKSVALRLEGDHLRDYSLAVTRDCVNDLANTLYTASAGRLLVSVLSAKPSAFVLIATPALTHIKENLRHPKAPTHSQDLLKILHVVLETRLLLVDADMSPEDREDFGAVDDFFRPLYQEVYQSVIETASKMDASEDHLKMASQAVQGAGALISQKPAKSINRLVESTNGGSDRLLAESTCSNICDALFAILLQTNRPRSGALDELINETTKALQRAVRSFPGAYKLLVDQAMGIIRGSRKDGGDDEAVETIAGIGAHLAFIGCSELPTAAANGLNHFVYFLQAFLSELYGAQDSKATPRVWCSVAATVQSAVRHFSDACQAAGANNELPIQGESWLQKIEERYPQLVSPGKKSEAPDGTRPLESLSAAEVQTEFIQVSLFVARQLYRRATKSTGNGALGLSDDFTGADVPAESQYLHLVSTLAGFVIHELSEAQQLSLQAENLAVNLFNEDSVVVPEGITEEKQVPGYEESILQRGSSWDWLVLDSVNVLSFSILEALRSSSIDRLFVRSVAQDLILSGSSRKTGSSSFPRPVTLAILTILANKHKIEALPSLISALEQHATNLVRRSDKDEDSRLDQIKATYALAAGMMRRYIGKEAKGIVRLLLKAPREPKIGHHLARQLEMIAAPQQPLTKEKYATVKPLWMQKVYFELVSPMLRVAVGVDPEVQDQLVKTNYSVGVLLVAKHMNFPIYEADADKILRISIAVAQNIPSGPDAKAALDVLKNILVDAPEQAKGHLGSIIKICIGVFSGRPSSTKRPDWLPEDYYTPAGADPVIEAGRGKLALEIAGALPRMFDSQHLLPHAPQVQRELTLACGHRVRDLRRTARLARAAWAELK